MYTVKPELRVFYCRHLKLCKFSPQMCPAQRNVPVRTTGARNSPLQQSDEKERARRN